jgi:hypothetical protein
MIAAVIQTAAAILNFKTVRDAAIKSKRAETILPIAFTTFGAELATALRPKSYQI